MNDTPTFDKIKEQLKPELKSLEDMRPIYVYGKLCMYTEHRIKLRELYAFNDERKQNLHIYSIRHADDSEEPCELCKGQCFVNRLGTIISDEKIELDFDKYYIDIDDSHIMNEPMLVDAFLCDEYGVLETPTNIKGFLNMIEDKGNPTGWDIPLSKIHKIPECDRRVFISQPFTGLKDSDIMEQRNALFNLYCYYCGKEGRMSLINQHTPYDDFDINANFKTDKQHQLYYFCRSIGMMGKATDIIIYGNWKKSRGCKMEKAILEAYGYDKETTLEDFINDTDINIIYQETLIDFCKNNSEYDDYFELLWPEEFDKMHEVVTPNMEENHDKSELE